MKFTWFYLLFTFLYFQRGLCEKLDETKIGETESVFGDIGDEVYTKLQIRKSKIPDISNEIDDNSDDRYSREERTMTRVLKPFDHFINPLYYRDFIAAKDRKPKPHNNLQKKSYINQAVDSIYKPLSAIEVIGLNNLHKQFLPSLVHAQRKSKKSSIAQSFMHAHAIKLAKALRSSPTEDALRDKYTNSYRRRYPVKEFRSNQNFPAQLKNFYNAEPRVLHPSHVISNTVIQKQYKPLLFSNTDGNRYENAFTRNNMMNKVGTLLSARKHSPTHNNINTIVYNQRQIPSLSMRRDLGTSPEAKSWNLQFKESLLEPKSNVYHDKPAQNNSFFHDLSKITMHWTGYKALEAIKSGKSGPEWLAFLKGAMQPKRFDMKSQDTSRQTYGASKRKHLHLPILSFQKVKPFQSPAQKITDSGEDERNTAFDNHIGGANQLPYDKEKQRRLLSLPSSPLAQKRKMKEKNEDADDDKDKEKAQEVINIYPKRPPQDDCCQQKQTYQMFNQSCCQQQQQQQQQQQACCQYQENQVIQPNCCQLLQYETAYQDCCPQPQPVISYQQQQSSTVYPRPITYTQPGVIPLNYYHSETLPDGRVRPALYPIASHLHGKCLPESSLCDKGHHEQCCGAATFCVDYWGISKCLAFNQNAVKDPFNPYQMRNDLNYKNYYKYIESSI